MKLPIPASKDLEQKLLEFDSWITASNGSIKETLRFSQEINDISEILLIAGQVFKNFENYHDFNIHVFSKHVLEQFNNQSLYEHLLKLAKILFMVSGKSDNNIKCQFPVYLSSLDDFPGIPLCKAEKIEFKSIPRVLTSETVMQIVARLSNFKKIQEDFLTLYVSFILDDESTKSQFWALGNSFFKLREIGRHNDLLAPLVQFQIRGSVTASGGHVPENTLRNQMSEWGLVKDLDYNSNDIVVSELLSFLGKKKVSKDANKKTRAYDFVLPFKTRGWTPKIFIQCQFYGGDSGSVSHKNVDQARNSRNEVLSAISNPVFIEFVDGAGYFSSLNGDLKKLLAFSDTDDFIQLKTAPIKLRRAFQIIGFLAPLEIEHAILLTDGKKSNVENYLLKCGYPQIEVERSLQDSISNNLVEKSGEQLKVHPERIETIKRYLVLDVIATRGRALQKEEQKGAILIPGYAHNYGLPLSEISKEINTSSLSKIWNEKESFLIDIEWLCRSGYVKSR